MTFKLTREGERVVCGSSRTAQMILPSSNTWLGAGKDYVKTKTSQKTSDSVVSEVGARVICLFNWINRLFYMDQAFSVASFR